MEQKLDTKDVVIYIIALLSSTRDDFLHFSYKSLKKNVHSLYYIILKKTSF